MPNETWHYLENQFDTVTRTSRKRMNSILVDHKTKIDAAAGTQGAPLIHQLGQVAMITSRLLLQESSLVKL